MLSKGRSSYEQGVLSSSSLLCVLLAGAFQGLCLHVVTLVCLSTPFLPHCPPPSPPNTQGLPQCWRACRFDIFVCTAAERRYAFEVWRLLDPAGTLIPPPLRARRIVNVAAGRLKTLPNTLGLAPHGEEAPPPPTSAASGAGSASDSEAPAAPMPQYAEGVWLIEG